MSHKKTHWIFPLTLVGASPFLMSPFNNTTDKDTPDAADEPPPSAPVFEAPRPMQIDKRAWNNFNFPSETHHVFFEVNTDHLNEEAQELISSLAERLQRTGETFEIHGCASPDGYEENFKLSHQRARTVLEEFKEAGVFVTEYQRVDGKIGQDRDVIGYAEGCPPLPDNIVPEEDAHPYQRADITLNPNYPEDDNKTPPPTPWSEIFPD